MLSLGGLLHDVTLLVTNEICRSNKRLKYNRSSDIVSLTMNDFQVQFVIPYFGEIRLQQVCRLSDCNFCTELHNVDSISALAVNSSYDGRLFFYKTPSVLSSNIEMFTHIHFLQSILIPRLKIIEISNIYW